MQRRPKRVLERLSQSLNVASAVSLFDEGNTVPFVARYRQENTGGLDDTQLRQLHSQLDTLDTLENHREEILHSLSTSNTLTDVIRMEIEAAESLDILEEIYQPLQQPQVTPAQQARDSGLEPLALRMIEPGFSVRSVSEIVPGFPLEEALDGARHILAEDISRLPDIKEAAQRALHDRGVLVTSVTEMAQLRSLEGEVGAGYSRKKVAGGLALSVNANDPQTYKQYFSMKVPIKKLRAHQILAINRAEKLGFLNVDFEWDVEELHEKCISIINQNKDDLSQDSLNEIIPAVWHGIWDLLKVSTERRIRKQLTERAANEATSTFSRNLWSLLLAPPFMGHTVMGIDPGYSNGCKICVCNCQGTVTDTAVIYPHTKHKLNDAVSIFVNMILQYSVEAIALGDGVGSRDTEIFIDDALKKAGLRIGWSIVSENGASVYSASELASQELPDLDVSLRGAVSIARRLQDPLAELVKVDPAHLGIGMYQHDIEPSKLAERLKGVVESAVNTVGVDVNTASSSLLAYVSGLSPSLAQSIVQHRTIYGDFMRREEFIEVPGIDERIFEQCAGFLRIRGGKNALDNTSVHPESYHVIHSLLQIFVPDRMIEDDVSLDDLAMVREVLNSLKASDADLSLSDIATTIHVGLPTFNDIIENVLAPGRDVRGESATTALKWTSGVSIENLAVGDQMLGVVKNVVDFGAFVDVNIGIRGLIHVRHMKEACSTTQWLDPYEVCKVGDKLQVEIVSIDLKKQQVSLKMVEHELDL